MSGTPLLYNLHTTTVVRNATCHCHLADADTPNPSLLCSWDLDEYLIYVSFAISTFSVMNMIMHHGFINFITSFGITLSLPQKLILIVYGIISGCYGLTIGLYMIYVKSITNSFYLLSLLLFLILRIAPLGIIQRLLAKLFPFATLFSAKYLHNSNLLDFFTLVAPFWFLNLLKGAEFFVVSLVDARYKVMLRNTNAVKTEQPSLLLTVPCDYGKEPSLSGCIQIHSMLDPNEWFPILDKMYANFFKPGNNIMEDPASFIEYSYGLRKNIRGVRILAGNYSFLQPFSTYENIMLMVDTLLIGILLLMLSKFCFKNRRKCVLSMGVVGLEIAVRITLITLNIFDVLEYSFALLGIWTLLEMSFCLFLFLLRKGIATIRSSVGRAWAKLGLFSSLSLLPVLVWFAGLILEEEEKLAWNEMNEYCTRENITQMVWSDARNVIDLLDGLQDGVTYELFQHEITKAQLMKLVEKNELEYMAIMSSAHTILYQEWSTVLRITSILPLIQFVLIVIRQKKTKGRCFTSALGLLGSALLMIICPLILWVFWPQGDCFEISSRHDEVNGVFVTSSPTSLEKNSSTNGSSLMELYKTSEKLLGDLIVEAYGFEDCYREQKYKFPRKLLFQLKTNLVNIKTSLIYKTYFIFCVIPLLFVFQIHYTRG